MPKPNGAKERAEEINKVRNAWSVQGKAIIDFLPENGQIENDYNALQTLINTNKYGNGREEVGAFLCMYMLGQKDSEGNNLYNVHDIITPGRLVAEKKALYSKLMKLDDFTDVDTDFMNGVKRSCDYMRGVLGKGLLTGNISEIISPEAATISNLAISIFNNNAELSYKGEELLEGTPVHRLKYKKNFDLESVNKSYGAMIDMIANTSQNLGNLVDYVENGIGGRGGMYFTHALANYIMFDGVLKRSKDHEPSDVVPSLTRSEYIKNVTSGKQTIEQNLTDFAPLEYSLAIVGDCLSMEDPTKEIDDFIQDGLIDDYFEEHPDDAKLQRKKDFVEAYKPYVENKDDEVYRYGIGAMYLNGNLFKNLKYSAVPYIDNKAPDGKMASGYVAFGKLSINFDRALDRENVLREAYLSDLDVKEYHFDPIEEGENGANIPAVNQARTEKLRQLKRSIDDLNPTWKSSPEWKNMRTALDKAISVSERYQNDYDKLQASVEPTEAKEALEELNSAMEMVQIAARKYVEHKVEKIDFEEGDDFERLKAAKMLENFGRNQGRYLTAKLADEVMNTLELEPELHIESVKSDAAVIKRLYGELDSLYQETRFHSTELDELIESLDDLISVQKSITGEDKEASINKDKKANKDKISVEDDRRYYGVTTSDKYTEGAIAKVIEKAQKYIDHRITEGLSKDRYTKRVDMAMRIKNYLEKVQDNADRTQNKRLEPYRNIEEKINNKKAFNVKYDKTKSALRDLCNKRPDGKIPDDSKEMVKDSLYFMLARYEYDNDRKLISKSDLREDQSEIVKLVEAGDFKGAINFMKKDVNVKEFVDSHCDTTEAVGNCATDMGCSRAMQRIKKRAAKRKTIDECVKNAKKIDDGNMDKKLLATYIVCNTVLKATKDQGEKLERTDALIEKTQNSKELEAIINRYQGTKDFASKMEAMYCDYAQLAVFTEKGNQIPENIDKFFEDLKANKIDLVKGGNEPAKENKPQADAKKPEEVKQIQEVVKIN